VAKLSEGIEAIFGKNGARAILLQVGRMQAKWGVEENPDIAKAALEAMSGMSEHDRAKTILTYTAHTVGQQLDAETWIEEEGDDFLYKDRAATHCFNRRADVPVCHTAAGFLAGLVVWAVGNTGWKVEETGCMAMGQPLCTYRVYRETAA